MHGCVKQIGKNPTLEVVLLGGVVVTPTVIWWRASFGGYAGRISPQATLDALQNSTVILVDIR